MCECHESRDSLSGSRSSAPCAEGGEAAQELYVDEETFCLWMDSAEFRVGRLVQKWWAELDTSAENELDGLKTGDDETTADLFRQICSDRRKEDAKKDRDEPKSVGERSGPESMKESIVLVSALVDWLEYVVVLAAGLDIASGLVEDDVMHELEFASRF